jgi:hypothetical protein
MSDSQKPTQRPVRARNEDCACQHCGALVYGDSSRCSQCGKFPVKLHKCADCGCISDETAVKCWKCGRVFEPDGEYL